LHLLPSYAPAARTFAHLLIEDGHNSQAIDFLETFVARVSNDAPARELLAWALFKESSFRRSIEHLKVALHLLEGRAASNETLVRVENNIGVCYGHLGNAKSAASWCERAIAVDPNRPEPVHNLARLHLEMNRPKIATEVLVSFAQRTPFNV